MLRKIFAFCILGLLLFIAIPAQSQIDQQDFSNVKVDNLSDAQIRQFMQQVETSGLGDAQLEQVATAKGMPTSEVSKLRARVERLKKQDSASGQRKDQRTINSDTDEKDDKDITANDENSNIEEEKIDEKRSRIFGALLFSNSNLTFEPNLRIATPVDYQIGPDDEILIDIYGYSEANYELKVSPEGTINIPLVGVVTVSGASIEAASSRIRAKLANIYPSINTGATQVSISLGNIRSIRVVLTGEVVKPGTYTLPSVAMVFNALYASGGPNENGSFRQIQIIRGGETIGILDIYDFLMYGSLKNNIRLQDQDVIRIPTYKTRVEINGEVKRTGIFEMKFGETLSDLIRFAGDFTESAYKARIKVLKITDIEREIADVTKDQFNSYEPSSGDQYFVEEILDRFTNRVTINGAVFRPGQFELEPGLTLRQLIVKAEGLKEDAFQNRGYILRLKDDLTTELLSFNTAKIVTGTEPDISLKREDIITIPSIFDLKEEYTMSIDGEVRNPGTFKYADNTSLEELIIMAGGFKEGATAKRIEISRRIKTGDPRSDTSSVAQVFIINVDRDLKMATGNFTLKPFDIVSVRPAPGYEIQKIVKIEGEVLYPGNYTIANKNERISDLIKRAGGLTVSAYKEGASLKRINILATQLEQEKEELKLKQFEELQRKSNDSAVESPIIRNDFVGIDLPKILRRPGRNYDLLLEEGDMINIPKELQTVKVSGEILSPASVVYTSSGFKKYILNSGGFSPNALKRRSYITYANGATAGTKNFLFFKNYPPVKPGAEIFVPLKPENKNQLTTTEVVAISTGLATIATLIFTILR